MSFFKSLLRNAGRVLGTVAIGAVTGGLSAAIGSQFRIGGSKIANSLIGFGRKIINNFVGIFTNRQNPTSGGLSAAYNPAQGADLNRAANAKSLRDFF